MEITLSDGTNTINLPPDMQWTDEFSWTPVEHSTDYSETGSLIVQEGERQDGRPITLETGDGMAFSRAQLQQVFTLASIPEQMLTLNIWGQSFIVMFWRPAITAKELYRKANPGPDHPYTVTLNFMEINP